MIKYYIARDAHLVTCRVTTSLRVLDIGDFMEQLFADPAFDANCDILVIVEKETVAPDIMARNGLAKLLLSWRELHVAAKVGIVLPGSGWRRIAVQLIDNYGLGSRNVRCFRDEPKAMLWFQEMPCAPGAR